MSATEFLAHALSPQGSADLPYKPEQLWTVRQHISDLVEEFATLVPRKQLYTHHDGRSVQLLLVAGTLPMYYQDVKYNIPVELWLPDRYPLEAPMLYVRPTPDMIIKPRHSFVDASGFVRSSYVVNWNTRSNLAELCQSTSMEFGGDPPLFSKPPGWTPDLMASAANEPPPRPSYSPPPQLQPPMEEFQQNPLNPSPIRPHASGPGPGPLQLGAQPFVNSFTSPGSGGQTSAAAEHGSLWQSQQPAPANLTAVFRERAITALSERLHASLTSLQGNARADMERLLETQQELQQRGIQLRMAAEEMAAERHALESSVIEMNTHGAQIERWLRDNESKTPAADIDPDTAIVPVDELAAQALEVQAEDMALEDTLYALQKAFQGGHLDATTYLRQVRQLCAKQFFARALGLKVAAQQQQQTRSPSVHAPGRSAGPSNGTLQMPISDAWANAGMHNPLVAS